MLTQRFVASINWSESLEGDIYRQQGHLIDLLPFGNNGKYAEIISYVFSQFKKKKPSKGICSALKCSRIIMSAVVKHTQRTKVIQTSAFGCFIKFYEVKSSKLTGH